MIIISIITFIVAIALPTKISPLQFARLSSIAFLFSAFLSFNVLYLESLGNGIGLFSGLYHVSPISQSIEIFIYLIASLIVIPWYINNTVPAVKNLKTNSNIAQGPLLSEYSIILLFSVLGGTLLISSADLIAMYLSIELQSFAVYILAAINRDSEAATAAGLKYFLLGGLSSCFILLGAALIYSFTGLTNIESIFNLLLVTESTSSIALAGILFIVLGFLFKIAAAPLHNWAPDVYDEVPSIVTTWLTIMPKISIVIFLFELVNISLFAPASQGGLGESFLHLDGLTENDRILAFPLKNMLLLSSLLSLIIGSIVGLAQYKIKRLLAYSTISHVGFLLLALGLNTEQSTESLIFYLVQYSFTNLNTFLILLAFGYTLKSSIITSDFQADRQDIRFISELKGQFINNPLLSLSLAVCLFSMAGIPPLLGFFAKQQVLYAATYSGYYFMAIVAILVSVVSAYYYLHIIKVMHFSLENTLQSIESPQTGNPHITNTHSMLISILTLGILLFMLNPNILLNSTHLLALTVFQT